MRTSLSLVLVVAALSGCAMDDSPDGIDEVGVVPGGKADGSDFTPCELDAVVAWLNEGPSADAIRSAGVHTRAAANLVDHRDGADATFGTADDDLFDDIGEVDDVYYVGPVAIEQLVASIGDRCATPPPAAGVDVVFSPEAYESSHLARVYAEIEGAERSIDIAMYSFRDSAITAALERAVDRGVTVRFLFQTARDDRSDPEGSTSARLEAMGIEVRWINQIMHHKFAIIDGARTSLDEANGATLITGSGNWSNSAATRFDENTLVIHGNVELNLRYQREFNHLWDHGRLFVSNETIPPVEAIAIDESDIPDDPSVDALFTSANFRVYESSRYGWTFSALDGMNTVADRWVALIESARTSIHIASGHLRSRPIAEALIAAHRANPDLDIQVYLDAQEYLAASTHEYQLQELAECLTEAGDSVSQQQDCTDRGFLFAYQLHEEGIPVRFKYYAYRWDHSYADQMHHKYMIVDGEILVSGSYNLSDNAEHATMENIVVLEGEAHRAIVDRFRANFDAIWVTGEAERLYESLMDEVQNGTEDFPIVFPSMALDHSQVTALKNAIRDACPLINTEDYRQNAARHRYCDR